MLLRRTKHRRLVSILFATILAFQGSDALAQFGNRATPRNSIAPAAKPVPPAGQGPSGSYAPSVGHTPIASHPPSASHGPAAIILPQVPECGVSPPRVDSPWGSCAGVPASYLAEQQRGNAHTHTKNEILRCGQTPESVEVHIKTPLDTDPHSHQYCIRAAVISCAGVTDTGEDAEGGQVELAFRCAQPSCCKGPLTSDGAQSHCAGLSADARKRDAQCNHVFVKCGGGTTAVISDYNRRKFCRNAKAATQAACVQETIFPSGAPGESADLPYKINN